LSKNTGKLNIASVLNAPWPEGKPVDVPVLQSNLEGVLKTDSFLILSNSPYRVTRELTIDGGATLYIEPGVEIKYDQNRSIIVEDGGIMAKGNRDYPIKFTASTASPSPGFYASAVRFMKQTTVNSAFSYCIVKYAETAIDIYYGAPDISSCYIAYNSQGGIFSRNDSAPKVMYNTFERNGGEGAIKFVGMSRPLINNNNFINNDTDIQAFSTIYIDAANNWWGKRSPDMKRILGDTEKNIKIKPWLKVKEPKAFREVK